MKITDTIINVGVTDRLTDLFEGQYLVPDGIRYNSYVIRGEKTAVIDSVDSRFSDEWLNNIERELGGISPDYLVIQHMEPDHSGSIAAFTEKYKDAKLVSSAKAYVMMKNFYGIIPSEGWLTVGEGDVLSLGSRDLTFVTAPMVHWPEVIVTYDNLDKVLFSADGFGSFGSGDASEAWDDEARRYYIGIVGKYGLPVTNLLKKASKLDISVIAPLHGPILTGDLSHYLSLYTAWASYTPEDRGVVIAYASIYGNTKKAAEALRDDLTARGEKVAIYDLARCDKHKAVADAFRYDRLVLAAASYNADVFPPMREFINKLTERGFCRRTVGIIQNGSWAPSAAKVMRALLEGAKDVTFTECEVTVTSALTNITRGDITRLADELCK